MELFQSLKCTTDGKPEKEEQNHSRGSSEALAIFVPYTPRGWESWKKSSVVIGGCWGESRGLFPHDSCNKRIHDAFPLTIINIQFPVSFTQHVFFSPVFFALLYTVFFLSTLYQHFLCPTCWQLNICPILIRAG